MKTCSKVSPVENIESKRLAGNSQIDDYCSSRYADANRGHQNPVVRAIRSVHAVCSNRQSICRECGVHCKEWCLDQREACICRFQRFKMFDSHVSRRGQKGTLVAKFERRTPGRYADRQESEK